MDEESKKKDKTEGTKAFYFFDEAGDPQVLGRRGINLIEKGTASKKERSIRLLIL